MKVILQKNLYERGQEVFDKSSKNQGIEYFLTDAMDETAMLHYHRQAIPCFVIGAEKYSNDFYQTIARGSVVIRYGVGYNAVPVDICKEKGILVAYTPGTLTDSVAEHTFALLLSLCRHIPALDKNMKNSEWKGITGIELKGKTIAILGFGQIGQAVARIAKYGFGMKIHAFDKFEHQKTPLADIFSTNYEAVVTNADIVSLHMAVTPETKGFFNDEKIAECKDGVLFINTARGELVNEKDLYEALITGKISAAAIDVFSKEPYAASPDCDFRKLPNVVLSPHCGSNTREANQNMAKAVVENILRYYNEEEMTLIPELKY